jgi:hypothetical protein
MRELIYLSERKIQQFTIGQPWWRRMKLERIKIPMVGEIAFSHKGNLARATNAEVDRILAQLDKSSRATKWFDDPEVRPGDWVQFELPLTYVILTDNNDLPNMVVFHSWPGKHVGTFLLHGSIDSLVGNGAKGTVFTPVSSSGSGVPAIRILMAKLAQVAERQDLQDKLTESNDPLQNSLTRLIGGLDTIFETGRQMDLSGELIHSAWMAGCARITLKYGKWLAATPLYVEYISPPD